MLKIREFREDAHLTQKQLAEKISTMQRNVSNWEQGVTEPDLKTVVAIADLFEVSLDELFGREKKPAHHPNNVDSLLLPEINNLTNSQKFALYELLKTFEDRVYI